MRNIPTFFEERRLLSQGYHMIVGVDEAGCGALAGPVMAGAVVLPLDSKIGALKDSKLLSSAMRERLFAMIIMRAKAWAFGEATVEEIAKFNVRGATFLAMRRAIAQIQQAQVLLVDAWKIPDVTLPQINIIRGDRLVKSIAAASIVAKVSRDRFMQTCHEQFPEYGFDQHKGYGTMAHRQAIHHHGPCPIHRLGYKTFRDSFNQYEPLRSYD